MILICGASGLVGKELSIFLDNKKINYIGTYNKTVIYKKNFYKVDFSNIELLETFLITHKITSCVFCIVERLTDLCENYWSEIKKTNIDLVNNTSYLCNKLNIQFIHLSTDYVFDGNTQPNYPDSLKNPLQNYGISKLISEYRTVANCNNYCIIRTPVLYSKLSKLHDNAVCLIGKKILDLRRGEYLKEDNYSIRRPLYIPDLCEFIYDCYVKNYTGIYHFYNPFNKYTKYEISNIIAIYLNIENKILPDNNKYSGDAPRPYDTQLKDNNVNIQNYKFTDFNISIHECFQKLKHPKINIPNKNKFFICFDMDGTIIDTNIAHYMAYKEVFQKYNKPILTIDEWNDIILNNNIDNYLQTIFEPSIFNTIKIEKLDNLSAYPISFTKNSEHFLKVLIENDFNICVVTNTNIKTVELFKQKLPLLNKINNWIYRDDYNLPKPNSESYELAIKKYYKNEEFIIGFEDSMVGYKSLRNITNLIYIFNNKQVFNENDCYLFDDYDIFTKELILTY